MKYISNSAGNVHEVNRVLRPWVEGQSVTWSAVLACRRADTSYFPPRPDSVPTSCPKCLKAQTS